MIRLYTMPNCKSCEEKKWELDEAGEKYKVRDWHDLSHSTKRRLTKKHRDAEGYLRFPIVEGETND